MSVHQTSAQGSEGCPHPGYVGHEGGHLISLLGGDSRDQDLLGERVTAQPPEGVGAGGKALTQAVIDGGDRAIGATLKLFGDLQLTEGRGIS